MIIKLGKVISEYSVRNKADEDIPVYSVTNDKGFCTNYFSKDVSSKDRTTYKIVPYGYFAYNPSRINVGSVDWQHYEKKVIVSPLYVVFYVDEVIDQRYLLHYLKSDITLKFIKSNSAGSVRDNLKLSVLQEFSINLRTKEEQYKIVNILDKVDLLISLYTEKLKKFDELTKSLFIEMFGDIINTSKYPTVNLGSLGEMLSGGTPSSKHSEYFGGNIPFISTPCLGENYISYKNAQNFLTDEGVKNSTTNLIPAYSVMIGSRVGVGKCSINMCEMCTNQDILSFINIDKTKYDLLFIKNVIEQHFDFYESQKRGATIKGISSKIVKETKVPKAPLLLQKKFANFVRGTDKSKLAVKKSLEELEILKKSLMQKYFA